jgi:hypothetical protein
MGNPCPIQWKSIVGTATHAPGIVAGRGNFWEGTAAAPAIGYRLGDSSALCCHNIGVRQLSRMPPNECGRERPS